MNLTGAEIIIELLERQGIQMLAGIPGGANLPMYDALSRHHNIRHILARHEQGAGFIAQGMARVTGRPQVFFATSGPGATNVITALADAKLDSIPVICITGQVPRAFIGTDAFQEVDTYSLSIPVTKHGFLVRSARELFNVIPEAFRIAASGRPGPVLIDVPKDVQLQETAFDCWPVPGRADPPPDVHPNDLSRAADMIASARRPILYIGGGIIGAQASDIVVQLAEKAGIPVVMTLMGLGAVPSAHHLALGMLGMHAALHTNMALESCDLLIAAGVRFDDRATGKLNAFCPRAKVIHIDIDSCEMHKLRTAHVGIVGDVKEVLADLLPMVPENRRADWREDIADLRRRYPENTAGKNSLMTPADVIRYVARHLDAKTTIVTDVGQHQMWTAQIFPFQRPRQFLTSGGLGTMGFGLPTAIGAALACQGGRVVCFSGDGSLLMNLQEMATAVEEGVDIKIILLNNNALGLVHQQQKLFYKGRIYASEFGHRVDFIRIAQGFGLKCFDLAGTGEPYALLSRALDEQGPCLIHVSIEKDEMVYPMVPPGAANTEMVVA